MSELRLALGRAATIVLALLAFFAPAARADEAADAWAAPARGGHVAEGAVVKPTAGGIQFVGRIAAPQ